MRLCPFPVVGEDHHEAVDGVAAISSNFALRSPALGDRVVRAAEGLVAVGAALDRPQPRHIATGTTASSDRTRASQSFAAATSSLLGKGDAEAYEPSGRGSTVDDQVGADHRAGCG